MLQHYYDVRTKDKFDALFGDLYIGKYPTRDRNSYLVLYLNFSGIIGELHNYRAGLDAHCQTCFDYFCDIYAEYLPQGIKEQLDAKNGAVEQLDYLYHECERAGQDIYLLSMSMTILPVPSFRISKACTDIRRKRTRKDICVHSSTR